MVAMGLLVLVVALVLAAGSICGFVALARIAEVQSRLRLLDDRLWRVERNLTDREPARDPHEDRVGLLRRVASETPEVAPAAATASTLEAEAPAPSPPPSRPTPPPLPRVEPAASPTPPPRDEPPRPSFRWPSFEFPKFDEITLGTRWMAWVGVVFTIIGIALFLKYAYDINLIGPRGRLAVGAGAGIAALLLGERFRRKDWPVLFQALTGLGIAAFYICVCFSFHVYELTGQPFSFACAIAVTAFAIAMAVTHDAPPIALLALIGGFLSPVLISTRENHPYGLFTYLALLDVVAIGAAYYRRWRALDVLCFAATAILYQGWYAKFAGPARHDPELYRTMILYPGVLYASVFYLMFLLIPAVRGLFRRVSEQVEDAALVAVNAAFSFYCFWLLLYHDYRQALGFVVLGQALLVFLLFQAWRVRVSGQTRTAESLLIISLALVTLAIPIQLKAYGIPLAWAMEGVVFTYLGIRFQQVISKVAGAGALVLATGQLFHLLPLHRLAFFPVFNGPFGSWVAVIVAATLAAYLLYKRNAAPHEIDRFMALGAFLLAFTLGCMLLTMEVSLFWSVPSSLAWRLGVQQPSTAGWDVLQWNSLVLLWVAISLAVVAVLARLRLGQWVPLALACQAVLVIVLFGGFDHYRTTEPWLLLNWSFLTRVLAPVSLWWGAYRLRRLDKTWTNDVPAIVGHALLVILLANECFVWGGRPDVSDHLALSFISAAWAVQAFALIWAGLAMRNRVRRIMGFVLFGIVAGKVCLVDTHELERVFQIVSFIASGVVALVANYFYHRYARMLLGERAQREEQT